MTDELSTESTPAQSVPKSALSPECASEQERVIASLGQQLRERESVLRARDEGIAWLRAELAEAQQRCLQVEGRLAQLEDELRTLKASPAHRLALLCGRAKHRLLRLSSWLTRESQRAHGSDVEPRISSARMPTSLDDVGLATAFVPRAERGTYDIVCFPLIDWTYRYQRPQHIAAQFAERGHRVFYINATRFLADRNSPRFSIEERVPRLYEVTLAALYQPDLYRSPTEGANEDSLLASLDTLRAECDIEEAFGVVMLPCWLNLALNARRRFGWPVVYDCMDEWEGFPGIGNSIVEAERELVTQCDLLVVSAQRLFEKWQPKSKNTVLVRNGVDYEFFQRHLGPSERLRDVPGPVMGYYGALHEWLDIKLLAWLARERPDYSFVFVGTQYNIDLSELERLPNIYLLGEQPYDAIPEYLYCFDVCLIPFLINRTTNATDPVKLYEYLGGGKPVVATPMAELLHYDEHIYIARTREEFAAMLDEALAENDPQRAESRRAFARDNTWSRRYETIARALDSSRASRQVEESSGS